jgi:hypothetical protein
LRNFLLLIGFLTTLLSAHAQRDYWQQQVNHSIEVTLNEKNRTLDGFSRIEYINHSPDTLQYIWFHVWPNAYKTDRTAFSDQLLENDKTQFYFSDAEQKGYINRLDFKVNGKVAETTDHPQHIDIIRLELPEPLPPGGTAIITTPFHVKLPYNFSRGGYVGETFQVTQWYPKPAVYDNKGWHPMPYLDQGEFYSEFGNYEVNINVPDNYVVAATGTLKDDSEKEWLTTRRHFEWSPTSRREKNKYGQVKTIRNLYPPASANFKTLHFSQQNVHDFAWFADKRFVVEQDTCLLPSGKIITVSTYYPSTSKKTWQDALAYAKSGVRFYSREIGEYPYDKVSVVEGPLEAGGGMEYPGITIIAPGISGKELDKMIAHEIGHNWFYGALASNERQYPWLDEGFNSFYERRYTREKYGNEKKGEIEQDLLLDKQFRGADQPINTPAAEFGTLNYGLIAYGKTADWLNYLDTTLPSGTLDRAMRAYYQKWKHRHPSPEAFRVIIDSVSGQSNENSFALLEEKGFLPCQKRKGFALGFGLTGDAVMGTPQRRNLLLIAPALGFNSYDKFMFGFMATNYLRSNNRLRFFIAPLVATGSKRLTGIGTVNYSFFPEKIFRQVQIGVNGAAFTMDQYNDPDGAKTRLGFRKIVPFARLVLKERSARSPFYRYIQFKSFLINEEALQFYRDTVVNGNDTTLVNRYRVNDGNRVLNQLKFVIENNRKLYPYKGELQIEQAKDFVRVAFTGNYFFNYPKHGGLQVRVFAGKFFYSGAATFSKQFATDRYHLNMTGANGYEDYTYSDYFIGRNKFEGFASQQIMERDGGFKVRTDLLANKVGKTDDWLTAINLHSTVLPFPFPLRVFADIGTYAGAWERNANTDRFLFDAGLQFSLFKESINIYVPLVYSRVYKNYIQSTVSAKKGLPRLAKTISFSIDISNFSPRKIHRELEL